MRRECKWCAGIIASLLMMAINADAAGILDIYRQSKQNDPLMSAAAAEREAAGSLVTMARGQLLPQVNASWSSIKNDQQVVFHNSTGTVRRDYDFRAKNVGLSLSQALFRPQLWAAYAQAGAQIQQAEGIYQNARQDLITRVAEAYFDVLMAEDNVTLASEQKNAISEQLSQAKRYYEAGIGTVTDINEAQARYDSVIAQEISAKNTLEIKYRNLETLTGEMPATLRRLSDNYKFEMPDPVDLNEWLAFAQKNNPQLKAREAALDVASKEVYKNLAGHLPTADLVGGRSRMSDPSYSAVDTENWNTTIGIQVSIPLFSSGVTQGRVNQSASLRQKATHELEAALRALKQETRQQFLAVVNGVAQVKALEQAVKSNNLALYSAKKGQEAGVRTSFDVLNAQQLLFTAKRDLYQARYSYAVARLKLQAAAGMLDEEDVAAIDRGLVPD